MSEYVCRPYWFWKDYPKILSAILYPHSLKGAVSWWDSWEKLWTIKATWRYQNNRWISRKQISSGNQICRVRTHKNQILFSSKETMTEHSSRTPYILYNEAHTQTDSETADKKCLVSVSITRLFLEEYWGKK